MILQSSFFPDGNSPARTKVAVTAVSAVRDTSESQQQCNEMVTVKNC